MTDKIVADKLKVYEKETGNFIIKDDRGPPTLTNELLDSVR